MYMGKVTNRTIVEDAVKPRRVAGAIKPGAAMQVLRAAVLGALVTAGMACSSQKKDSQTTAFGQNLTHADRPQVISSTPQRDAIAFTQSNNQLTATDFGVIDRVAPKPVWEKYNSDRNKIQNGASEDAGGGKIDMAATQPAMVTDTLDVVASHPNGFAPTSALASTLPSVMTLRPARLDLSNLPVTISEMPDGKLRLIWVLRSYGGTTVAAAAAGGISRRAVTVTPADLAPLVSVVTQQLGGTGAILPLPRENTLVITCAKEQKETIINLLAGLDVPPRQVEITAKIFEVSHDFDYQQGARLLFNKITTSGTATGVSTFDAARFAAAPLPPAGNGSVISLMKAFQDAGINIEASFQLMAETGLIRVVSSPRMTVAAGQTGYMLAGQELPIQSTTIAANATTTATTYKPVGVQLYITPQAVSDDRIKLHAISIVSSVAGFTTLPTLTGGSTPIVNPIIESREAETAVTINNGHTLVISGLRMIRTTTREQKVPGLGDLPAIGNLFKNHRSQQQMTDLYFFVTPTLL
jgi:type II secretory pathway component GspD/PulD (secretin)